MKHLTFTKTMAIDGGVLAVILVAGLVGFWPVFGGAGFIRPALIGLLAGAVVALLGFWWRCPAGVVALGTVVAYLLLGTAAALPKQGLAGVVPTGNSFKSLIFGSVQVWRQFVTASTPLGSFAGFTIVPFLVALVGAAVTFSLVWRLKRAWLALLPAGLVLAGVIALGTSQPFFPTIQGICAAILAVGWLAWRQPVGNATAIPAAVRRQQLRNSAVLVAVAAVVAGLAGPSMSAAAQRDVVRLHTVPPLDLRAYASPLVSFRSLVDNQADDTLLTVTGWNSDYRLRLAVMDAYDGMVYNVGQASGASRYDRVGPDLGDSAPADQSQSVEITVTVGTYSGVWVPTMSTLDELNFISARADDLANALFYNPQADAVIDPVELAENDSYICTATVMPNMPAKDTPLMNVILPRPQAVPEAVADLAATWTADAEAPLARVNAIVQTLHDTGFFSHGLDSEEPSLPGHSAARIADLIQKPQRMVGDDEQYAVTAALMLQSLGIPARVVMGFRADEQSQFDGTTWTVTGSDAHAWIEVPFQGYGWVPFDPTPDENQQPTAETQQRHTKPKPQVLQPPPAVNNDDDSQTRNQTDEQNPPGQDKPNHFNWGMVAFIALVAGVPLLLLAGPPLIIGLIKSNRRQRRATAADSSAQVTGGWQELLDRAADVGTVMPPAATRRQAGAVLTARHGVPDLTPLVLTADAGAFAPTPPAPDVVESYWAQVNDIGKQLQQRLSWWGKYKARVSLISLRKHPQPTVSWEEIV